MPPPALLALSVSVLVAIGCSNLSRTSKGHPTSRPTSQPAGVDVGAVIQGAQTGAGIGAAVGAASGFPFALPIGMSIGALLGAGRGNVASERREKRSVRRRGRAECDSAMAGAAAAGDADAAPPYRRAERRSSGRR